MAGSYSLLITPGISLSIAPIDGLIVMRKIVKLRRSRDRLFLVPIQLEPPNKVNEVAKWFGVGFWAIWRFFKLFTVVGEFSNSGIYKEKAAKTWLHQNWH